MSKTLIFGGIMGLIIISLSAITLGLGADRVITLLPKDKESMLTWMFMGLGLFMFSNIGIIALKPVKEQREVKI